MIIDPVELERLSKAATQGVWTVFDPDKEDGYPGIEAGDVSIVVYGSDVDDDAGVRGTELNEHDRWANAEFIVALVNAYRTGQLVPAMPSGDVTDAAFEVGQQVYERIGVTPAMREVMELCKSNRAATSQPSGDVVEAVARKFQLGDRVTKTKGSSWTGLVVGFYSTSLTPIGYAVESENEPGSVQIYPESALDAVRGKQACLKARENGDG